MSAQAAARSAATPAAPDAEAAELLAEATRKISAQLLQRSAAQQRQLVQILQSVSERSAMAAEAALQEEQAAELLIVAESMQIMAEGIHAPAAAPSAVPALVGSSAAGPTGGVSDGAPFVIADLRRDSAGAC